MVATGEGANFLHVINVYAPSGEKHRRGGQRYLARERLLHLILLEYAVSLGDVPVVVLGDLNTDPDNSPSLREALRTDWHDASELQSAGQPPPPTFFSPGSEGTRIDYVLLNARARLAFWGCTTTDAGLPGHRAVSVTLDVAAFAQRCRRYRIPRCIPRPHAGAASAEPPDIARVHELLRVGEIDHTWRELSQACERYLLALSGETPYPRRSYIGRGEVREPTMTSVCAHSTPQGAGAATLRELRLRKLSRRLAEVGRSLSNARGDEMSDGRELLARVQETAGGHGLTRSPGGYADAEADA